MNTKLKITTTMVAALLALTALTVPATFAQIPADPVPEEDCLFLAIVCETVNDAVPDESPAPTCDELTGGSAEAECAQLAACEAGPTTPACTGPGPLPPACDPDPSSDACFMALVGDDVCNDPAATGPANCLAVDTSALDDCQPGPAVPPSPFPTPPNTAACQAAIVGLLSATVCPILNVVSGGDEELLPACLLEALGLIDDTVCDNIGDVGTTSQACAIEFLNSNLPVECQGADAATILAALQTGACQEALTPPQVTDLLTTIQGLIDTVLCLVTPIAGDECTPPIFTFSATTVGTESGNVRVVTGTVTADEDVTGAVLTIAQGADTCAGGSQSIIWTGADNAENLVEATAKGFTATLTCALGGSNFDYVITVTGEGESETANVDNVAFALPVFTFGTPVIGTEVANVISVTGTASSTENVGSAVLSIATTGTACSGGSQSIIWTGGTNTAALTATPKGYTATLNCAGQGTFDYVITLTGGGASQPKAVDDVVFAPLNVAIAINSVATQDTSMRILMNGDATATEAADDAGISIALADDQDPDTAGDQAYAGTGIPCDEDPPAPFTPTNNILWNGETAAEDLVAGVPEPFDFFVCSDDPETVTFTVTVTVGASEFTGNVEVDFAASSGTEIVVSVSDVAAEIGAAALSPATYSPDGTATPAISSVVTVTDKNGVTTLVDGTASNGRINDANLVASLAKGTDDRAMLVSGASKTGATTADITVGSTLPANLKDGTYVLTATYDDWVGLDKVDDTKSLAVNNMPPTISVAAATPSGTTRSVGASAPIAIALKDANIGTLEGTAVTELANFAVTVAEAADCAVAQSASGVTFAFSGLTGTPTVGAANVNYAATALTGGQTTLNLVVGWTATTAFGTYYVCGQVSDDGGVGGVLSSAKTLLATLTLSAINGGFHLTVDDGGDGLMAPDVDFTGPVTTEALRVLLSGTEDAEAMKFTVGTFINEVPADGDFVADPITAKLCLLLNEDGDDCADAGSLLGTATGTAGVIIFVNDGVSTTLTADLEAGIPFFVLFTFTVPEGTAAGNYSATIDVEGTQAAP